MQQIRNQSTVSASAGFFSLDAHPADLTVVLDCFRPFAGFSSHQLLARV